MAVFVLLQIERDGFFAAIDAHEVAGLGGAVFRRDERAIAACIVAFGRLDLDHPRAKLRHHQGSIWSRQHPREIEHQ
jgi:hypothetical protein